MYLRKAADKKYFHSSMSKALWSRVSLLLLGHDRPAAPPVWEPRCSHCRKKKIYAYLGMLPSKTHCPFATLKVNTDAIKKAIKQAVEALKTHPEVEAAKVPFAEIVWLLT